MNNRNAHARLQRGGPESGRSCAVNCPGRERSVCGWPPSEALPEVPGHDRGAADAAFRSPERALTTTPAIAGG